ncbi:MAG: transglutaminase-like domain-containing protein [Verrucomicrobiota bacterium]
MLTEAKKEALLKLMDDESPTVRRALLQEISNENEEGVGFLQEVARQPGSGVEQFARDILKAMGADDPDGDFVSFIRSLRYELETGCFLLERTVHPHVDWREVSRFLDAVSARCGEFIDPDSSTFEKCKQINLVLFHEYGFEGDVEHFHDPENNFIRSVIERRRGIPISLSIIYLLVADRCRVSLDPIGAPGRFLLASLNEDSPFYIDPFDRGRIRSEDEVRHMLLTRNIEDGAEYLLPSPVGEVICRICRNLVHQYTLKNDLKRARQFAGYIQEFEQAYERESP